MPITFDPFDAPWREVEYGESRGILVPALASAMVAIGLTLLILFALHVTEASSFAPLATSDAEMRRYAEAGYFPLIAAANAAGRHALATGASLQTFGGFFIVFSSFAYGGWRGFSNLRARSWTNAFWISCVIGLSLAPRTFDGLTLQTLDYAIGLDQMNERMLPMHFLVARGLFAAIFASVAVVFGHDLGFRLRESLEDFGLVEVDDARNLREKRKPFKAKGWSRGFTEDVEAAGGGERFGQRGAPPPRDAPPSEETRARTVLGVGLNAGRKEIERAYRSQMKRAHPDHGGSVERAAELNAARDLLLRRG